MGGHYIQVCTVLLLRFCYCCCFAFSSRVRSIHSVAFPWPSCSHWPAGAGERTPSCAPHSMKSWHSCTTCWPGVPRLSPGASGSAPLGHVPAGLPPPLPPPRSPPPVPPLRTPGGPPEPANNCAFGHGCIMSLLLLLAVLVVGLGSVTSGQSLCGEHCKY